jgi:hypothetical protein
MRIVVYGAGAVGGVVGAGLSPGLMTPEEFIAALNGSAPK